MLDSGGDDEGGNGCHVRLYFGTLTFICELPNWLPDYRIKHVPTSWDAATIARLGRNYYYEVFPREYGFSFDREGSLHVHYGPQMHDGTTTKSKCYFLPWANWRFIGQKWYGLSGELLRTGGHSFKDDHEFEQTMPTRTFEFDDFDGKRLTAKTHIEEREWRFGTGWCKWLSVFRKPKVRRSLSITFSDEVGPEKGSWKGGTIGTSIGMLPGELHEEAFKRFCETEHRSKYRNYGIKYVGRIA